MLSNLYYDYFLCNLKSYVGIDFPITKVLFYLTLALIVVTFFLYFQNRTILFALKRLYKHKCIDRESAQTIEELHLTKRKYILYLLKTQSMLSHYIRRVPLGKKEVKTAETEDTETLATDDLKTETLHPEEDKPTETEHTETITKVDFKTDTFYLDEKYFVRSKNIIDRGEEPLSRPLLSSIAFLVVFIVLFFTMPSILTLLF